MLGMWELWAALKPLAQDPFGAGCIVAHGFERSLTFLSQPLATDSQSPSLAQGQRARKHRGNTKRHWLLDLVTLKPAI